MKIILFYLFLICNLLICKALKSQNDWKLKSEKKGVLIYSRKVKGSKVKAFKGIATINAPLKKLYDLLVNHNDYPSWVYRCAEGKTLEKISDTEYYVYLVTDSPWPASERDDVTHVKIVKAPDGTVVFDMKDEPDYLPQRKSRVRVPFLEGYWKLAPLEEEKTKVIYEVLANPGGRIPAWLANHFIIEAPLKSLLNMKKKVESRGSGVRGF